MEYLISMELVLVVDRNGEVFDFWFWEMGDWRLGLYTIFVYCDVLVICTVEIRGVVVR